jgi:GNAT superfamily N-acetyltransferase
MQRTAAVETRLLFESDIPAAMRLKEAAGWNQTDDDWRRLLLLEPEGCFGAIKDDALVGTTTTTTYGNDLAWIGMVLVDPQHRRQGIAAKLINVALDYLNDRVETIKLDATALGKPVYEKFGFRVESVVERWVATASWTTRETQNEATLDRDAVRELLILDRLSFAADRSQLIEALMDSACVPPVLFRTADGALSGYALARSGTKANYVGPVVATDPRQVKALLEQVMKQLAGARVYIDFNKECRAGTRVLSDAGFVKERDFIRMVKGGAGKKTSPLVVAIAGPEIG